jgi:predicted acylesterase/phospholipase RssA
MRLARLIAKRQRQAMYSTTNERSQVCTITILRGDQSSLVRAFVDRLVQTLQGAGSIAHLNYESIIERFGIKGDGNEAIDDRIIAWLNDVELRHRFVIYEADTDAIWWTQLCLRQADRILTVVPSATDTWSLQYKIKNVLPSPGTMPRNELIVLYSSGNQAIAGTTRLLSEFNFERHHHIDVTSNEDFKKLARLLTGKSIGLVLSGGGARGFAHIGVIRALSEWKVPFDWVGGTSMGALIAAQQALGWDWQTMLIHNKRYWNKYNPQRDYTFPIVSINSGRKLNRMLRSMYGNVRIEDLKTNFFCVSTNLSRAEIVVYQKGSLRRALRASLSIPGIGPPVFSNRELFVDGGLLNNLPIDVMSKLCQGRVLAVDVTSRVELLTDVKNADTLSVWKLLAQRLNPWAKRLNVPSMFTILQRATMLNSIRFAEAAKCQADLYLNPPVSQFGLFDWQKIEEIIETAYVFAITKLTEMADQVSEKIER